MSTNEPNTAELEDFLGEKQSRPYAPYIRWGLIGLAAIIALLVLMRCAGPLPTAGFVTEEVKRGTLTVTVSATGNLAPTNQIDIGSELSGIVERVLVDVNDRVERGETLALLDTLRLTDQVTRSRASLASAEASVAQARATLSEAQAQLARFEEVSRLSNGRVPSQTELNAQVTAVERAGANLRAQEASVSAARAQLSSDQTQLAKAVIRSPVSGVVLRRSIDPGQTVQAAFNTPSLFIIAEDLTSMKLEVGVDEADVARVREGMQATFTVDAYPGREFSAAVSRVSLGARNVTGGSSSTTSNASNVVSYLATLTVTNTDLSLRPGMTATATIQSDATQDTLIIPNAALRFTPPVSGPTQRQGFTIRPPNASQSAVVQERSIGEGSQQRVFVLEADQSLREVTVVTGPSDGRYTAVTADALAAGARVITGQTAREKDG
jgi:HlyD family secretion protein